MVALERQSTTRRDLFFRKSEGCQIEALVSTAYRARKLQRRRPEKATDSPVRDVVPSKAAITCSAVMPMYRP